MPSVNFQAPTDYSAEAEEIARRRKYAEMLAQQSMEPLGPTQMAGGWAIPQSPLSGLAKMLQAYSGRKGQDEATAQQKALGERYSTERGAAMARALRAARGVPGSSEMIMDETANGGEGQMAQINAPGIPRGGRQAYIDALVGSKFPDLQNTGQALQADAFKIRDIGPGHQLGVPGESPMATAPFKPDPLHFANLGDKIQPMDSRTAAPVGAPIPVAPAKPKDEGAWGEPYNLGGAYVQKNSLTGQIRQAVAREPVTHVNVPPPITAVTLQDPNDPTGTIIVDGRTRQVIGKGPKLTDTGKMEKKREFNMQGIGATIQSAENLLKGTGDQAPTQSGVGTVLDAAGAIIGKSPRGAAQADQLKAIGGALVSKVPRMEGPQSDKDVLLYKEMAGQVGNSTIPAARRLAALEEVKNLWAKYERLNPEAFADRRGASDGPPPGAVRRIP